MHAPWKHLHTLTSMGQDHCGLRHTPCRGCAEARCPPKRTSGKLGIVLLQSLHEFPHPWQLNVAGMKSDSSQVTAALLYLQDALPDHL